jgi:hypothetical protein
MSDSDDSDFKMHSRDVDELIKSTLSSGSKTPDELLTSVLKKAKVTERTYYRHLEKLQKSNIIERLVEKNDGSHLSWKYILRTSKAAYILFATPGGLVPEILPSRRYLELAAWLKREPDNWNELEAVRKAKIMQDNYSYLIPLIETSCEDPDQYACVWSDEPCGGQRRGEFV